MEASTNFVKQDIKMRDVKKINFQPSSKLKVASWFERRLIFRGKSYPVKNLLLIAAVFLTIFFLAAYFLIAHRANQADSSLAIQKETKELTDRIGRFMELPAGEQPTLATVTDQDKLKGQNFFAHAQNGDKLLVWPEAKKAILYRPSTGKIIEVSNLTSGDYGQIQSPDNSSPTNQ
jgi:hypothetical protein